MAGKKDMYLVWIQGFVHFFLKEEEVPRGEDFSPRAVDPPVRLYG
jgi:hypothetical protein